MELTDHESKLLIHINLGKIFSTTDYLASAATSKLRVYYNFYQKSGNMISAYIQDVLCVTTHTKKLFRISRSVKGTGLL